MYFLFLKPSPECAILDSVPAIIRAATRENPVFGVSNRVRHPQEKARIWKFGLLGGNVLYYPFSENKGTDQLCSYCKADLRFSFA